MILPRVVRAASRPPPTSALVESLILVSLVWLFNIVVYPGSPGFHGWPVNPYVVPVLLAGCRYGLLIGMFAALLAAVAHLGTLLHATTGLEGAVLLTSAHLGVPLLLLLTGIIGGHFADHRRNQLAIAVAALDRSVLHRDRLSTQFTLLSDEKHLLDKQVLSADEIFEVLASISRDTARLRPGHFPRRILQIAVQLMGGGSAALYRIVKPKNDAADVGLLVRATDDSWPRGLNSADPVFRTALARTVAVSLPQVRGWSDAATFAKDPVHVACGLEATWRRRRLVLVMRDVPFHAFSAARLRSLTAALRSLAKSLSRAQRVGSLESERAQAALERAAGRAFFKARLDAEVTQAERTGGIVKLVKCRLIPSAGVAAASVRNLKRSLRQTIAPLVRSGEIVLQAGHGAMFTVLCPAGGRRTAEEIMRMLRDEASTIAKTDPSAPRADALVLTMLELDPKEDGGGPDGE